MIKTQPKSLCILPWMSLETTPTGAVRPCCMTEGFVLKKKGELFNLNSSTLSEVWTSPYMDQLRQDFLDGKKPEICNRCWSEEEAGIKSKRIQSLEKFSHKRNLPNNTPVAPQYLDLKLSNTCNLKCRTCSSDSSSKWAQDEIKLKWEGIDSKKNLQLGKWSKENNHFWTDLEEMIPSLELLDFTGGEPFLIQEHFDLLKKCVEQGHAHKISLHYNTNGTIFPETALKDYWPHFKNVEIMFSIDGSGEIFNYLRHLGKWEEVESNLRKFQEFKYLHLEICYTVSALNIHNLPHFVTWSQKNNWTVYFNMLHEPLHYCIQNIPEKAKHALKLHLEKTDANAINQKQITAIIDFMMKPSSAASDTFSEFFEYVLAVDKLRGENFKDLQPEYFNLLEKSYYE